MNVTSSSPNMGEGSKSEQELLREINRLCSAPSIHRVPRPPASSKEKLLRFRVRQRIKSVLERCDDYQASFTPKPGPSPQESSGNQSIQAAAPAVESGKPCAVISSDKQTGGIQEEPLSLQPPKQAQAAASSTQSLRLWQQQQLMKMRDMQKKEVMGLQERSCSQGGQGQATQDQQPAHSFEPIRLAFRDTTNRFNGSAGIEAAFKWQLHKREGLTNRERLQAGVRDLASEFYGSAREDLCQ